MPLLETKGAASAQGFGEFAKVGAANYIEDVFSTWLYTGTSSTQNIVNGIDLAGKGGLVWTKGRNLSSNNNLYDTVRGANNSVSSNLTSAQFVRSNDVIAFNSNGFTAGGYYSGYNAVSWTFREQPKFFDVVTYTGNGSTQAISHSLGSVPGCIIIKSTNSGSNWIVYHRSLGEDYFLQLNLTDSRQYSTTVFDITAPTSTAFTVGSNSAVNSNGDTYVAYLFAHNAGGFGLTGTDNVISCGSYTGTGAAGNAITLGYEPQWLLIKRTDSTSDWAMFNNMMGMTLTDDTYLWANLGSVENTYNVLAPTATGFVFQDPYLNASGGTYIYIAIRRGPMKTPTTGTSVFNPVARTGTGTNPTVVTTGNNPDLLMSFPRTASPAAYGMLFWDKLRGVTQMLRSSNANAETAINSTRTLQGWTNTGYQAGADFIDGYLNYSGSTYVNYPITRAPGFFDVVCYTGTGSARTVNHNLGVVPEMMIVKRRNDIANWTIYLASVGNDKAMNFDTAAPFSDPTGVVWNLTTPTSTVFSVGTNDRVNGSGSTYVNYLFASCPGVSKVGSYTGSGTTKQIDCGFTGGARFVLIKRTDSTGDWYCWDSSRGIVSGNDPYLLLNSTAAEVTNTDYIDTYSAGFEISSTAPAAINANGGTFIFLAIA
jgi:hypothetical protein